MVRSPAPPYTSDDTWGNIGKYKDTNLTSDLSVTLKDIVPGNSNLSLEFSYGNLKEFSGTYSEELWNQYKVDKLIVIQQLPELCNVANYPYPKYDSPNIQRAVTRSGNYTTVSVKQYINELNDVRPYIKLGVVNTDATPTYRDVYNGTDTDTCFLGEYELEKRKKNSRNGLLISSGFDFDKFNIEITLFNFKKEKREQEGKDHRPKSAYNFSDKTSYLRLSIVYSFMF